LSGLLSLPAEASAGSIVRMTKLLDIEYMPGLSLRAYCQHMSRYHPQVLALLDPGRMHRLDTVASIVAASNEFDSNAVNGRGDSYREAQRHATVRAQGFQALLRLAVDGHEGPDVPVVLDVLGGDGTLARAVRELGDMPPCEVITSDISGEMVARALDYGLPAVRQPAQRLLLRDGSVDAVLIAYGTHHIEAGQRELAIAEALRIVRPGGRIVVHDFEPKTPMARFFREVVNRYTLAGHPYSHPDRQTLEELLCGVGCIHVSIEEIDDSFCMTSDNATEAEQSLLRYVRGMYGLVEPENDNAPMSLDHLAKLCSIYFGDEPSGMIVRSEPGGGYVAILPRRAVVAHGSKPGTPW
jgi:SAM-dependent methyltransferase